MTDKQWYGEYLITLFCALWLEAWRESLRFEIAFILNVPGTLWMRWFTRRSRLPRIAQTWLSWRKIDSASWFGKLDTNPKHSAVLKFFEKNVWKHSSWFEILDIWLASIWCDLLGSRFDCFGIKLVSRYCVVGTLELVKMGHEREDGTCYHLQDFKIRFRLCKW